MKIKDAETPLEKSERYDITFKEGRNALPFVVILTILAILSAYFVGYFNNTGSTKSTKSIGNPYNCSSCKNLGRACSRHLDYNADEDLRNKIHNVVYKLDNIEYTDDNTKYSLYVYPNLYNTECDYCKENNTECQGCKYTRLTILEYYNQAIEENGIPNSDFDKDILVDTIFNKIKQKN
ncbi:MAG: hypothetical protein IJ593_06955 [Lachnospiraceae bacterium]|nr:hypothetical protein [Lachnospiraceae bacterium]